MPTGDVADSINKLKDSYKDLGKEVKGVNAELDDMFDTSDDIDKKVKKFSEAFKAMSKDGSPARSLEEQHKVLEDMVKTATHYQKAVIGWPKPMKTAEVVLRQLITQMTNLRKEGAKALNDTEWHAFMGTMGSVNKLMEKNTRLARKIHPVHQADRSVRTLLGGRSSPMDHWHSKAQASRDRRQDRVEEFEERVKNSKLKKDDPAYQPLKLTAKKQKIVDAYEAASAAGSVTQKLERQMDSVRRGGSGSLLSRAAGGIEGGTSAVSEMLGGGVALPVMGALALLYEGIEKNQKMNSDVNEQLGKGGIYGGQQGPGSALYGIRDNLNLHGLGFSKLGIGYDKNLALAKAMTEGGFGVSNLAEHPIAQDNKGLLSGSFGTMQRNAYAYGKMAGLSPNETMTQTIKLITQYQQSLGATEDFFIQITKDTHAAGISTTKYIELIDDVNSHYDRSNKLLMTTVEIMRMLSSTGRETADSLKDNMALITNQGKPMATPQAAFSYMQILKDSTKSKDMIDRFTEARDQAAENVAQSIPGASADQIKAGVQGPGGADYLTKLGMENDARFHDIKNKSGLDTTTYQSQNEAIDKLRTTMAQLAVRQQAVDDVANGASIGGTGIKLARADENLGPNVISNSMEALQALQTALHVAGGKGADGKDKYTLGSYFGAGRTAIDMDQTFGPLLQTLGVDPKLATRLGDIGSGLATTKVDMFKAGGGPSGTAEENKAYMQKNYTGMKAAGFKFGPEFDTGDGAKDLKNFVNKSADNAEKVAVFLTHMDSTFTEAFGGGDLAKLFRAKTSDTDRANAMANAESLTLNTRSLKDTLEDVFTKWFTTMVVDIHAVVSGIMSLVSHFHEDTRVWASDDQNLKLGNITSGGKDSDANHAEDNAQTEINEMWTQYKGMKAGPERDKLKAMIDQRTMDLHGADTAFGRFRAGAKVEAGAAGSSLDFGGIFKGTDKDLLSGLGLDFQNVDGKQVAKVSKDDAYKMQRQLERLQYDKTITESGPQVDSSGHTFINVTYNNVDAGANPQLAPPSTAVAPGESAAAQAQAAVFNARKQYHPRKTPKHAAVNP